MRTHRNGRKGGCSMRIAKKFGNLQKSDYLATVESPPKGFEELKTTDFRMPDGERHIEFNY
ncbi:hypothetical protein A5CBH24_14360 [Alistipes communis]|uniref:Uncharacterized protein n=1 Tax=Alistipes communis TaxID=2585118 RepID=A0A4Y1XKT8_9BACT|nr:hypothetical protein A5CBH24_14360 [Alistipes communis]BBL13515.1 hypothetical protein A6CPBBH3_01540 [Alistipes communis]